MENKVRIDKNNRRGGEPDLSSLVPGFLRCDLLDIFCLFLNEFARLVDGIGGEALADDVLYLLGGICEDPEGKWASDYGQ